MNKFHNSKKKRKKKADLNGKTYFSAWFSSTYEKIYHESTYSKESHLEWSQPVIKMWASLGRGHQLWGTNAMVFNNGELWVKECQREVGLCLIS